MNGVCHYWPQTLRRRASTEEERPLSAVELCEMCAKDEHMEQLCRQVPCQCIPPLHDGHLPDCPVNVPLIEACGLPLRLDQLRDPGLSYDNAEWSMKFLFHRLNNGQVDNLVWWLKHAGDTIHQLRADRSIKEFRESALGQVPQPKRMTKDRRDGIDIEALLKGDF